MATRKREGRGMSRNGLLKTMDGGPHPCSPKRASPALKKLSYSENTKITLEGKNYAKKIVEWSDDASNHFSGLSSHLIGVWKGNLARLTTNDSERFNLQKEALVTLCNAASLEKNDPEVIYSLGMELAVQRNLKEAKEFAVKYVDLVTGNSIKGIRLLAFVVSQEQEFKDAESIVDYAITHSGIENQLRLLRDKALLQIAQEQPKTAIETYRVLLALLQSRKESHIELASAQIGLCWIECLKLPR